MPARLHPHWPALLLAGALTLTWAWRGWADLSALKLPDTDDAMRLQQVRDWIAGQAFGDLHQYRLSGGLLMHWSRIGDLVPAGTIVGLRPWLGQHMAEVTAVILWPLLQFAAMLALAADIARRFAPSAAGPALLLAALAYPTTTLFMPGRIDHHALQVILVLTQVRALLAVPTAISGMVAGGAVAVGAAVGLETLPFACVTGALISLGWWRRETGAAARQRWFGIAVTIALPMLLPIAGRGGGCDTIQPLALPAIAGAIGLAALASFRPRGLILLATGLAVAASAVLTAPACLAGPYGGVDPLVARLWLARVEEAQPLFAAPAVHAIAYGGLLIAGIAASAWLARRRIDAGWRTVLAFQLASLLLTLSQLRGAYVGAGLAVVPIAMLIANARVRGRLATAIALWLAGAGLTYPLVAAAFVPRGERADTAAGCASPGLLRRLGALPQGTVMAPIDLGTLVLEQTHHRVIAAPYHRNNAGDHAMYDFFLGTPAHAEAIARKWGVDYVIFCKDGMAELGAMTHDTRRLAGQLRVGTVPGWMRPVSNQQETPLLLKVVR